MVCLQLRETSRNSMCHFKRHTRAINDNRQLVSVYHLYILNQEEARKRRSPRKRICYGIKEERKDGAWDGQTQWGAELLGCDAPSMIGPQSPQTRKRYAGRQKENNRRAREQGRGCTMFLSWSCFFSEAPYYYLKDKRLRKERSTWRDKERQRQKIEKRIEIRNKETKAVGWTIKKRSQHMKR